MGHLEKRGKLANECDRQQPTGQILDSGIHKNSEGVKGGCTADGFQKKVLEHN